MKQLYNSAWDIQPNTRVTYIKAPIIVPTLKSLRTMLPHKESLLDALIVLPLIALLAVVILL